MDAHACVIEDLLVNGFSTKTYQQKCDIIQSGRPRPNMPDLHTAHNSQTGSNYTRHFYTAQYDAIPDLTGCPKINKLFCWPCLLFANDDKGCWSKGFADLTHLSYAWKRHERSQSHLDCFVKSKLFGRQRFNCLLHSQNAAATSAHNERAKNNRDILKRLIDVVCFLAKQELPLRGHDEADESPNKGNFSELLETLRIYDSKLDAHFKDGSLFRDVSLKMQNDLIHAVGSVILDEIKNEVSEATFVAIMLDETSDVASCSQVSTVLRFVKNGVVHERFIGFSDMSKDKSAVALFEHVKEIVSSYKIGKLVGQAYDGDAVMSGHLDELQSKVSEEYPQALFTHCYAHVLNMVLQQGLSAIKDCRLFFRTLSGLRLFFSDSPKRQNALERFVNEKFPSFAPTKWNFDSKLASTVNEYRTEMRDFFDFVAESDDFDSDTIVKALGFSYFLDSFSTVFLLKVFSKIFASTDALYNIMQDPNADVAHCNRLINVTLNVLQNEKTNFHVFWCSANFENHHEVEPDTKPCANGIDESHYRQLLFNIIDNITEQIKTPLLHYNLQSIAQYLTRYQQMQMIHERWSLIASGHPLVLSNPNNHSSRNTRGSVSSARHNHQHHHQQEQQQEHPLGRIEQILQTNRVSASNSTSHHSSNLKKYRCEICEKTFSRSNTLVTHKRIHTGEKPFHCDHCGRAFRQPGNLTRHRLTHTTVKPYVCSLCEKAFNRASNLHTHMRTHSSNDLLSDVTEVHD